MNKYTAIYIRVSSNEQAVEGFGLDAQKEKCFAYANFFLDIKTENIKLYVDDGYSAKSLKRPMLKKMLKDIKESKIEMIIVYKLDRLTRNVVDTYNLLKELVEQGCNLISVMDHLDISTANGRMLLGFLSIIAQWESEVNAERLRDARHVMVEKGIYPYGQPPFGWKKDPITKQLMVDDHNATLINRMGDLLLEGKCLAEIRRELNEKYGLYFSKNLIKKHLKQEANIGIFRQEGKEYTGIIPPIMRIEKYNEIQDMLNYREHHAPNKFAYIFHSLIYCADCEKRMQNGSTVKAVNPTQKKTYYYYICPKCKQRISQVQLKKTVFISIFVKTESDRLYQLQKELKGELKKVKEKEKHIMKEYEEEAISYDIFKDLIKRISDKKNLVKSNLSCLKMQDPKILADSDFLVQYEIVHETIRRIYVNDKVILKIEYKK